MSHFSLRTIIIMTWSHFLPSLIPNSKKQADGAIATWLCDQNQKKKINHRPDNRHFTWLGPMECKNHKHFSFAMKKKLRKTNVKLSSTKSKVKFAPRWLTVIWNYFHKQIVWICLSRQNKNLTSNSNIGLVATSVLLRCRNNIGKICLGAQLRIGDKQSSFMT